MNKRPRRLALAAVFLVAAVVWLPLSRAVEGPVLLSITYNHGVHAADLLSVALVFGAALCLGVDRQRSR
ncbi:hypothetical protein GCM10009616_08950 [Microlunatus lacustris]